VQTQVRSFLLDEIKRTSIAPHAGEQLVKSPSLHQRAADSLIFHHLRASGYSYTHSIFASESAVGDRPLSSHDAAGILSLPQQALLRRLAKPPRGSGADASDGEAHSPLLTALELVAELLPSSRVETGTQTSGGADEDLETKLFLVDKSFEAQRGRESSPVGSLEEHMLRFQREADARAASQLQVEVARLRDVEMGKMRQEEHAKARAQIERVVSEQQAWHARQLTRLKQQEAAGAEALKRREEARPPLSPLPPPPRATHEPPYCSPRPSSSPASTTASACSPSSRRCVCASASSSPTTTGGGARWRRSSSG